MLYKRYKRKNELKSRLDHGIRGRVVIVETKNPPPMERYNDLLNQKYTHRQLADFYGVCWNTFYKWMKLHEHLIGKKVGHFYIAPQVRIIVGIYGIPEAWIKQRAISR